MISGYILIYWYEPVSSYLFSLSSYFTWSSLGFFSNVCRILSVFENIQGNPLFNLRVYVVLIPTTSSFLPGEFLWYQFFFVISIFSFYIDRQTHTFIHNIHVNERLFLRTTNWIYTTFYSVSLWSNLRRHPIRFSLTFNIE